MTWTQVESALLLALTYSGCAMYIADGTAVGEHFKQFLVVSAACVPAIILFGLFIASLALGIASKKDK